MAVFLSSFFFFFLYTYVDVTCISYVRFFNKEHDDLSCPWFGSMLGIADIINTRHSIIQNHH